MMRENKNIVPVHVMLKPEALAVFPDFVRARIELAETNLGLLRAVHVVTTLTLEQARLIYPDELLATPLLERITTAPTEHYIFHGGDQVHAQIANVKGKWNSGIGIRGVLSAEMRRLEMPVERYHNFVHSADTMVDSARVCMNLNTNPDVCSSCSAKSLCYGEVNS